MWIGVLWAGLRVAMWITHVGGKFRHGLLEKSLRILSELLWSLPICSDFFRFVPLCFQNKPEQIRDTPLCRPLSQAPHLVRLDAQITNHKIASDLKSQSAIEYATKIASKFVSGDGSYRAQTPKTIKETSKNDSKATFRGQPASDSKSDSKVTLWVIFDSKGHFWVTCASFLSHLQVDPEKSLLSHFWVTLIVFEFGLCSCPPHSQL